MVDANALRNVSTNESSPLISWNTVLVIMHRKIIGSEPSAHLTPSKDVSLYLFMNLHLNKKYNIRLRPIEICNYNPVLYDSGLYIMQYFTNS